MKLRYQRATTVYAKLTSARNTYVFAAESEETVSIRDQRDNSVATARRVRQPIRNSGAFPSNFRFPPAERLVIVLSRYWIAGRVRIVEQLQRTYLLGSI